MKQITPIAATNKKKLILMCMLHLTHWVCDGLTFCKDELISLY